jgi:hypothetical protein
LIKKIGIRQKKRDLYPEAYFREEKTKKHILLQLPDLGGQNDRFDVARKQENKKQ